MDDKGVPIDAPSKSLPHKGMYAALHQAGLQFLTSDDPPLRPNEPVQQSDGLVQQLTICCSLRRRLAGVWSVFLIKYMLSMAAVAAKAQQEPACGVISVAWASQCHVEGTD